MPLHCPSALALDSDTAGLLLPHSHDYTQVVCQGIVASGGGVRTLDITNQIVSPDGFERLAVVAGGTLPGPLISSRKGSRIRVNVRDQLTDRTMLKTTSIHWHGMFQKGLHTQTGPPAQTNTFWYRSHHELQYCDGLRGPMVIYNPQDPHRGLYDFDDERFHLPAPRVTPGVPPNSTLINGSGRFPLGPAVPLSIVNVAKGKRYRMRLISMAYDSRFGFSIDGHTDHRVIETDGINTVPRSAGSIEIYPGQRYSFILNANQPVGNYWIRSLPTPGPQGFADGINSAILRYKGAANEEPTSTPAPVPSPLQESTLAPLQNPAAPGIPQFGAADINLRLIMGQNCFINGVYYEAPPMSVLLQILSGARKAQDLLPAGSVYGVERDKVVEIALTASAPGGPHPFHLHGHAFSIAKGANNTKPNFTNPPRRDVVQSGPPNSTVVLRLKTDNAGPWMFHCHIEFHIGLGLAVVFAEDIPRVDLLNPAPQAWDELCPIYNSLAPEDQ
ncbi:laccase [Pterulicium gracile]|uniref:Laccase n=1 Tax=Pterulicium gracile TaxID=1884261 RepID=A0A5C3QYD8_9AGAR|nr:laccase [Pterula gracilis]